MIIGFIGAGVMARAIGKGLVDAGVVSAKELICSAPEPGDGQPFLDLLPGARWTPDNCDVFRAGDIIILAVKPQHLGEALAGLKDCSAGKVILSIAVGVTIEKLRGMLHPDARVIRSMPNMLLQIGAGASAYAGAPNATAADLTLAERVLAASGKAYRVEENQLDAVTALSGSGPAYVFHFIEAMTKGGVALGLSLELAKNLALQTMFGSAKLAAQSHHTPMELASHVKSPRGTTLAGCAVLEENDALDQLVARCMAAARTRAEELARGEK